MTHQTASSEKEHQASCWSTCTSCYGHGIRRRKLKKKVKLYYQRKLSEYEASDKKGCAPEKPKGALEPCPDCNASGLFHSESFPEPDYKNYPKLAIIGGGIGGVALAIACLHRGIPFTLYERDNSFNQRSQGYGLTLQQASKAIQGLGIPKLEGGIISTRHVVHETNGDIIVEWGARKWLKDGVKKTNKRTNIHIPRQALRQALLDQLMDSDHLKWGHQLTNYTIDKDDTVHLEFNHNGTKVSDTADLIIGADGIRSTVRKIALNEDDSTLNYLNCIVILGICPKENIGHVDTDLLDSRTVFQTVNGKERIYAMPFTEEDVMWQLSYLVTEEEAKELSKAGAEALKEKAIEICKWHSPVPEIVKGTPASLITGYPAYDRELLTPETFANIQQATLIGDAAHPMSPFKGQGANQALLDALVLARGITRTCTAYSDWRTKGIRETVLKDFEEIMLNRTAKKVKDSAELVNLLHSEIVLRKGVKEKGRGLK